MTVLGLSNAAPRSGADVLGPLAPRRPPQRHQDDQERTRAQAPQGTMEAPTGPTGSPATQAGQSHTPPGQNPPPSQTAQNTHFANVRYANFAKCMFCGALPRESARTVWRKDTRAPGGGQRYDDGSESRRPRPRRPTRHGPRRAPPHAGRTGAGPESRAEAALEDHAPTPGPPAPRPERGSKSGPKSAPRPYLDNIETLTVIPPRLSGPWEGTHHHNNYSQKGVDKRASAVL